MKFFSALATLLVATTTSPTVLADGEAVEVCSAQHDLHMSSGELIGFYRVTDVSNGLMTVLAKITATSFPNTSHLTYPYIESITAQACCVDPDTDLVIDSSCSPPNVVLDNTDLTDQEVTFSMVEPMCSDDQPTQMKLKINIEDPGGITAFNQLFPPDGISMKFDVNTDGGSGTGNAYFEGIFQGPGVPDALKNKRFNGYCVDAGNTISTEVLYDAIAYSFYDVDWSSSPNIGNIDKPENMPAVAYCVNHWTVGQEYSAFGLPSPYTLSSGTLQRAIWGIVDDLSHDGGCSGQGCSLGPNDEDWAEHISADCLDKGLASGSAPYDYKPGCGDSVPIIVVPTLPSDSTIQNQYVQTTFSQLNINCVSDEIEVYAQTHCTTGGSGSSGGDPHFKTFGGQWFDFHGACDLVLAHFPDFAAGLGLAIDVRTTTRYDYSFIETAAIQIGDDILEISSYGQYMLNSISQAEFPLSLAAFDVVHTQPRDNLHYFTVDLGDEKSIVVKVFKDLVYVDIKVHNGDSSEVKKGVGMLGTWLSGTRLGRDGVTVLDNDIEYGQEWQVRDTDAQLFTTVRAPQWPAKCEMPNPAARASRRLGENNVTVEEATAACEHIKNVHERDMCVFDVVATADLSLAQGGAY